MFSFDTKTAEILMYDVIGESWDGTGISASNVSDALAQMGGKRVTVRINSPGGIADEGIAIYNTLKRYKGGVDTVVDSLAASAASVIALAGDSRTTLKGSRWMIHSAMAVGMGNAAEMRKLAEILDVYDNSLADIYAEYMSGPKDGLLSLMAEETWYDSAASLAAGLSTSTVETANTQRPQMAAWFEHPPTDLLDQPTQARMKPQPIARELARLKLRLSK